MKQAAASRSPKLITRRSPQAPALSVVKECRQILLGKRLQLFRQAREAFDENYDAEPHEVDELDLAAREWSQGFGLRLRSRERTLLHKIDAALARIAANTYGVCFDCDAVIDARRLRARPEATLCIECKEDRELEERSYSD